MSSKPNRTGDSGKPGVEQPGLCGTLSDLKGPILDAMVILQSLKDEKCARFFSGLISSSDDMKYLKSCIQDVAQTQPDSEGRYRIPISRPGWYDLRFLWNLHEPPSAPANFLRSSFNFSYYARKDTTGKYNSLAQSAVFYFSGREDVRLDFRNSR